MKVNILEALALALIIFGPIILWKRLRFVLLRFFWKKDNFKYVVDVLFSLLFSELIFAIWLVLVFTVHNFLGFNIFIPLVQKAVLFLIFIILIISYIVEFYVYFSGNEKAKLYISPIKTIGFGKSGDEYILLLNGIKVVSSTKKDDLKKFLEDIKDYLYSEVKKDFEDLIEKA
jgi:FlaA1/EpsC-like NDP-sugar epimerase